MRNRKLGWRACFRAIFAMIALGIASETGTADAAVRISEDPGGRIGTYLDAFAALRASGERVIIDGSCLSACTMVLGMIPRERICVTSKARLGFHAAWMPGEHGRPVVHRTATKLLMDTYPPGIRKWISKRGGLKKRMIFLRGRELARMYPRCH
jgi:hypothetical protein